MLTCSWHRSKKEIETEIKKCFDLFDSDHSGKLDAKELAAVATTLGQV
jgi:Ca2+-binding EF-hand superfamily protein